MTYKNILLNCVLLNSVFFYSANAEYLIGEVSVGANEELTADGMNLTKLTMANTSSFILNGSGNIDDANFSGNVSDTFSATNYFPVTLFSTKTTFDNVDVVGDYNPEKSAITWGDQTSFWSNELRITGNVTMDTVQIGMFSDPVKGADFFDNAVAFDQFKSDYAANTLVVWNGGLYKTAENQGAFSDAFYADLANKVENGTLTQVNEMDQYTPIVGVGQSYKAGDVFQVIGTNAFFKSVGLIDEYPEGQESATRILAFSVSGNMNTLTPAHIMNLEQLPISYQSGVTIEDANVSLNRTSIMGHQEIDPLQRVAMGQEFTDVLAELHALQNLSEEDAAFIAQLDTLDLASGPDEFWNKLREYFYNQNYDNDDIKQAYLDTDAIHTKYLKLASIPEALPVTIQNSTVVSNNSSIQKQDSGTFVIDNSTLTLYGMQDTLMPREYGGGQSHLNHSGANGDIVIRNNSELNLYPYSGIDRGGKSGNIYVINSKINMHGSDTKYTNDIEDGGASINVDNGNIQLTNGSILNAYGSENYLGVPGSDVDFGVENWQEQIKAKSLYVNNSVINVAENSYLDVGVSSETDDDDSGAISMDVGGVINVHGGLSANIISLNTDTNAGIVNLYNNAWIDGDIYRANVFVNPLSEKATVNLYGRLSLSDSALDIGTNTLDFHSLGEAFSAKYGENYKTLFAEYGIIFDDTELDTLGFLHLNNSTIITHIDLEKNTNGIINVGKLEFGDTPSVVKIVVDDGVLDPQGATFDFLTGDTNIGDNLTFSNVMYDITYDNGKITLIPNGNSGVISLDDLNDRLAATGWLSNDFKAGSRAKMIADALNEWAQTDPESFKKAIKQIQPDTTPTQQANSQSTNVQIVNAVEANMGKGGNVQGRSGGDVFSNTAVWAQGLYNKSKLNTSNGFKGDTYGFAFGTEAEVNKNLLLGLGYAYTNSDIDTESRTTDVDTHTAILYGQYNFGDAFVNGIATYGFNTYEEDSSIKTAKYNMDSIFGQATTGYNFYVDSFSLTPQAGLRYLWTNTHSYTDSAEQYVSGSKTDTLTGVLGGSASWELQSGNVIFKPAVKALATYDMKKDADAAHVTLANGSSYAVSGSDFNRFGTEFGIGLNMNYNTFDLSLNYDIEVRENYTSQTGMLRAKYNF